MIFTVKMRNIILGVLVFLSVAFLYVGYLNTNTQQLAEEEVIKVVSMNAGNEKKEIQGIKTTDEVPLLVEHTKGSNGQGEIAAAKPNAKEKENYFFQARLDRERSVDKEIEILKEIINHPGSSKEIVGDAQQKLIKISERNTLTAQGESMLKAKGYDNVVLLLESDKATLVIDNTNLSDSDMLKIGDIVHRSTNYALEQIVIIPK